MIDLGVRTGLLDAIAQGAVTSDDLAARAGLQERYVREWLGAVVTAGIVDYDPATAAYTLPAEHTVCLTGDTEFNIAPLSLLAGLLAKHIQPVATAFREGWGRPRTRHTGPSSPTSWTGSPAAPSTARSSGASWHS